MGDHDDAQRLLDAMKTPEYVAAVQQLTPAEQQHLHDMIAYSGRVPVRVRGRVVAGDLIGASGLEDGTGIAVTPGTPAVGTVLSVDSAATPNDGGVYHAEISVIAPGASTRRVVAGRDWRCVGAALSLLLLGVLVAVVG